MSTQDEFGQDGLHGQDPEQDSEQDDFEEAQEGAELVGEGEYDQALRVLGAIVERNPKNEYAHYFMGSAHYEKGDFVKALRCYLSALELAPRYLGAMINTGHTLRMLGRYAEAVRMGKQALKVAERDADALYLIGVCYFARGDNHAAEEFLLKFLATRPEPELVAEAEGMILVIRDQIEPLEPES